MPNTKIKIAIGSDHAGFDYKEILKDFLSDYDVKDFGPHSLDSVDYPDFAHPVASAVENGDFRYGILLCGSANGVAITANKHQHIRAGLCWTNEVASLVRKHNDANVLCIPARFLSEEEAKEIATTFLNTEFEGGRHQNRVDKISC
ncbi:MAG: ribose 5-phosphate isomerase B [Pedobacter sp.]|uniref:ribose 5-phosphate isomerase B n=1 Tax=Pedobacter TaxID=84567 RepID=UPI0019A1F558|nr:ribose 5-phosphate isomerase B [Pedobacter aquatilis]MBC7418370.1 ribose 5-phosphate isomerase B [Pedobacter sp.]